MYELKKIVKDYGGGPVLDIDEMKVSEGGICAVVGPNGAGKTTLLRILGLLTEPSQGSLFYRGCLVSEFSSKEKLMARRQMGMVLQNPFMFNDTVFENVAYGLRLRSLERDEIKERVNRTLKFVGMDFLAARRATALSGGEKQRVALARALALEPQVLLLDEPTASLDPASVETIERLIQKAVDDLGATVVVVTHNLFQARRLADEVIFLFDGKMVEKKPASEFFSCPESEISTAFVTGLMVY